MYLIANIFYFNMYCARVVLRASEVNLNKGKLS